MSPTKLFFILFLLIVHTCTINGGGIVKSSLTFVIDDTYSMSDEISQVKDDAYEIFETVLRSNASQIDNFILVTFNDPDVHLRIDTKDKIAFKRALEDINVHGGGDCPEYAMTGIELALEKSLPLSYLFVFTDASAYDHYKYEQIKSISQKKQSQIIFVLTGKCGTKDDVDYKIYHRIAEATNGQVFDTERREVRYVLDYVKEVIKSRGVLVGSKHFPPGYGKEMKFPVDGDTKDVLIAVTGDKPKIGNITGPGGSKPKTKTIIAIGSTTVVKATDAIPGEHVVELGSESETHAVITAKTTINIQLGFSVFKPTSILDTVTRPPPEGDAFLSVKVNGGAVLYTAKILDMDDNVIQELPLELVNDGEQFYVTPKFNPPNTMFRVSVVGMDKKSKTPIKRNSPTPIERHNLKTEKIINVSPQLTIEGEPKIITKYDKSFQLKCKVHAYPKPDIIWEEKDKEISLPATVLLLEEPFDYISILNIYKPQNMTYQCKASNPHGVNITFIEVETEGPPEEEPVIEKELEELSVRKGDNADLFCRVVKGKPTPTVRWLLQGEDMDDFVPLNVTGEVLHLKRVRVGQTGLYQCVAENSVGSDQFIVDLEVTYPPIIKADVKVIESLYGDEVTIPCAVDGIPPPAVTWYRRGKRIEETGRIKISRDSLKLQVTIGDAGHYTCIAENELGTAKTTFLLKMVVPVYIESPKKKIIITMVGKSVILPCRADSAVTPEINWTFHSSDTRMPRQPRDMSHLFEPISGLQLQKMQLHEQGSYTCVASNKYGGSANITYDVQVYAPPIIENVYMDKTLEAVDGDLVLSIQCKATGSPKPTITWKKDDLNIAFGSEWYDIEEDGTLIIKNINDEASGSYVCFAQNPLGIDTEVYEVVVNRYPRIVEPISTIALNVDESTELKCDVPHMKTDLLRWYKDGVIRAIGELTLNRVTLADDGLYTCRVSDFSKSRSATTKVVVGFKPEFVTAEEEEIIFSPSFTAELVCEARGYPLPKATWKHNGKVINGSEMTYRLEMTMSDRGIFECEVSNELGSIHRSFNVTSRDCIFDVKKDFSDYQPLMLSPSLTWPTFEVSDGYMIVPNNQYFLLNCPTKFYNFASNAYVMAFCEGEQKVKIHGETYNFADIKCFEEVKLSTVKTGTACRPGNTEYLQIGYNVLDKFLKVYDVCFDKTQKVPLFVKHTLSPDLTDSPQKTDWSTSDLLPIDFDSMYDCGYQVNDIASTFGGDVITPFFCCFGKRQLVNPHDLKPGIPVAATFSYLNVVPHWNTCNSRNWDDVEKRVRKLAKSAGRDLFVSTGTAKALRKPRSPRKAVSLYDGRRGKQPVAEYLWKVVQDRPFSASLAIIQVNIPGLTPAEASKHMLCHDICFLIEWMKSDNWKNTEDGFTYCCAIHDFERAFGFNGTFLPDMNQVLFDVYLIPENYMTII